MSSSRYFQLLSQLVPPFIRGFNRTANIANRSNIQDSSILFDSLMTGIVVRSGAGTFDAQVSIDGKNPIPCVQLGDLNNAVSGFGQSQSKLIQEGTPVLVYKSSPFSDLGVIVGILPLISTGERTNEKSHVQMIDPEPSAAAFTEMPYRAPIADPKNVGCIDANSGRCLDVFPGDMTWYNEMGVGMALLHLTAHLKASGRAKLEMFYLDDLVRMVSGQYQHYSSLGEEHIYNDFGYVTREMFGSSHQCEVLGQDNYSGNDSGSERPIATVDPNGGDLENAKECDWAPTAEGMVPHRRFHSFLGHLGGLYQFFVTEPSGGVSALDIDSDLDSASSLPEKGLAHISVDDGGRIMVRSVSDILLERTNVIAVPRKAKEAWDPAGDQTESSDPTGPKVPYKWGDGGKGKISDASRPLQERDYFAWARKLTYQRFIEHSELNKDYKGKDWVLKEESAAPKPSNKYDVILENEEDYDAYEDRSVSISLRKDGGMTARNYKGAEISLVGDGIILSCPGDIQLRSGGQTVVLSGDDFVVKARKSVDISAAENDVRLKAERNLQAYSGNSILLDAGADDEPNPSKSGESAVIPKGIVLRSRLNKIMLWADQVQISAGSKIVLETIKAAAGSLVIAVKNFIALSQRTVISAKTDQGAVSGMSATGGNVAVFGAAARLIADKKGAAQSIAGGEIGVFREWADYPGSSYTAVKEGTTSLHDQFHQSDDWLGSFSEESRKDYAFTYRNPAEYGSSGRELYESLWAYRKRKAKKIQLWDESELRGTRPWPGKDAYGDPPASPMFYQLDAEVNIKDTETGEPNDFGERNANGGSFTKASFSEYGG